MATAPIDNQAGVNYQPIASRFVAETGYGDTNNLQGPSLLPGQTIKRSKVAKSLQPVAPVDVKAAIVANETRTIDMKGAPKPAFGMKNPNASPAKIPSGTNRYASSIIAPRGNARR
jgi:hypothetical protein